MKINTKLVVAATSLTLSIAVVLIPSEESMANILAVDQYNHSVSNHLVKYPHEISQQLMVVKPVTFNYVSGNLIIEKYNFLPCYNQERSPFISSIELLMRLLIIGSFGSVGIAGYSSFVERYFQIINKDLKIIYYSIFLLLSLQIIGSVIVLMSSPTSSIASTIHPSSSCILGKP
ncbi:hypothetical protein HUN01_20335 [Nostoc edaphicum CCNP1411]|uniref:Uncharacterized protein n=1 Tax=Nostoc edaphicum CCNP1411 TaxID=1472755 RepID=A0A7D7QAF3_9NOSO|nr:hypothetical protein [Nostoc edaphicum]QMS89815.1 hypothetical protein HUN01_20335 [Nostoc edaphicum CCNP1411]